MWVAAAPVRRRRERSELLRVVGARQDHAVPCHDLGDRVVVAEPGEGGRGTAVGQPLGDGVCLAHQPLVQALRERAVLDADEEDTGAGEDAERRKGGGRRHPRPDRRHAQRPTRR